MSRDHFSLIIDRMPEGGFVVTDGGYRRDPGSLSMPMFASTNIGEALAFIRDKLAPNVSLEASLVDGSVRLEAKANG